jgi:asparagine synthase (glutamine-hydrolysing)
VVALMCEKARNRVKTFSVGFAEKGFDESPYARNIARHLGADHTEVVLSAQDALELIPKLPEIYDEPFADSSQIPTFMAFRLARTQVTVALSGDGGDELFGGYKRYLYAPKIWHAAKMLPEVLRTPAASVLTITSMTLRRLGWDGLAVDRALKGASAFRASSFADFYWSLRRTDFGADRQKHPLAANWVSERTGEPVTALQYLDTMSYLPDDILTKVDRASMSVSVEARVPLLDDGLVLFAASLPLRMKIRGNCTKWLLRQVLYKYVPRHLVERPKAGFAIPLVDWLQGPLADWAESLLDERILRDQNLLSADAVRNSWSDFCAGKRANHYRIWALLMFQAWHAMRSPSERLRLPDPASQLRRQAVPI